MWRASLRDATLASRHDISLPGGVMRVGELVALVQRDFETAPAVQDATARLRQLLGTEAGGDAMIRAVDALVYAIAAECDCEPPDLSVGQASHEQPDTSRGRFFPHTAVCAEAVRSPYNTGSIIRSAEAFGMERCILVDSCVRLNHPRLQRAAMGADRVLPVRHVDTLPGELAQLPVFALETKGTPVQEFDFPLRGVVLVGNEELGLSETALALARESAGIVSIPLTGSKGSLNVGAAVAAVLSWWTVRLAAERSPVPRVAGRPDT